MPSQSEILAHIRARDAIADAAERDLVAVWRTLTLDDVATARREIEAILPLIIDGYGTPISSLAADWYDELREQASLSKPYRAVVGPVATLAQVESLAGWSTGALYGASPEQEAALAALKGGLQRLLTNADRDTIMANVARDSSQTRYARHASANACAFCAMLATRGAVFLSKESATRVVGRGTEKRKDGTRQDAKRLGIRARGKQALGEGYHDYCHCTEVPIFDGQDYEPAPYVKKFMDAYLEAPAPPNGGALDLKETLASMRQTLGTH